MRRSKSRGEFVSEIERFLHKRKREARNNIAMAERTLKEYVTPSTDEPLAIIVYPTVEGNNFELVLGSIHWKLVPSLYGIK